MTNTRADHPDDDLLWRNRWLMLASCVLMAGSIAALGLTVSHAWSWGLLVWGGLVGVAAALGMHLFIGAAVKRSPSASPTATATIRIARRRVICSWMSLFLGLLTGSLAAMFEQTWIDIAFTVYVVVIAALMAGIYRRFTRR